MTFDVCASQCDQCLFTANKIVSQRRMSDVLRTCKREDRHFVCHKHTIRDEGSQVCCRAFYDANPLATNLMRIAHRLRAVRFVDFDTGEGA